MKTLLITLWCIAASAGAQEFNEPIRTISGQRLSLQPLFDWWGNATANLKLPKEEQAELPPRPLPGWVYLRASEITNTGLQWIVRAAVQSEPGGQITSQLLVLRHGPVEEKKQVDAAAARFEQLVKERNDWIQSATNSEAQAAALADRARLYQEMKDANWRNRTGGLAFRYSQAAAKANREAKAARARASTIDLELERLGKITRGRTSLTLDTFALRTTDFYNKLPVYEMGLPFGR